MVRTSAFFGSVTPKAFCQKRLKLSFPAPFFFGSFLFGRTKRNEHIKKRECPFETPSLLFVSGDFLGSLSLFNGLFFWFFLTPEARK